MVRPHGCRRPVTVRRCHVTRSEQRTDHALAVDTIPHAGERGTTLVGFPHFF